MYNNNMRGWLKSLIGADKTKTMPVLSFPAISLLNISVLEIISDSATQARAMKAVADRTPAIASVSLMDLSVEAEAFGSKVKFSPDEVPTVTGRILEFPEDAEALKVPEVGAGRTGIYIDAIRQAAALITDRPVLAGVIGPFSLSGRLMDMSEIMVNCYAEPEMVETTLNKVTGFLIDYILAYKKAGANGVVMAEPAAGLLSPGLIENFSSKYVKLIADAVCSDDFILIYHNCGNTVPLLNSIFGIGADAYHFGNAVKMADVLKAAPKDVPVMGNIDPASVLRGGTPESVTAAVKALLEECGGYENFLISSGCDIPPLTPWENIDAYFAAVKGR